MHLPAEHTCFGSVLQPWGPEAAAPAEPSGVLRAWTIALCILFNAGMKCLAQKEALLGQQM